MRGGDMRDVDHGVLDAMGVNRCAARGMCPSFPHTNGDGSRNNQSGQEHPILHLNAKDAEFLNEDMHSDSRERKRPQRGPV
jgi:hypothetical protein